MVTLLNILLPVFLIIALGSFYAYKVKPEIDWINKINMDIFVPALIFSVLAGSEFNIGNYYQLVIACVFVVLGSGLLAWPIARLLKTPAKVFVPPMMFNNTGNMGIPLIVLAFGQNALPAAVTIFVTVNFLHFTLGLYLVNSQTSFISLFKVPMVLVSLLGIGFSLFNIVLPQALAIPLDMLGKISIPLMLFALGVRLLEVDFSSLKLGLVGAALCPVLGVGLAYLIAPWVSLPIEHWGPLLIFAALPPAVLNFMLAERFNLEPKTVASIVLIGNFASLFFMPFALYLALNQ